MNLNLILEGDQEKHVCESIKHWEEIQSEFAKGRRARAGNGWSLPRWESDDPGQYLWVPCGRKECALCQNYSCSECPFFLFYGSTCHESGGTWRKFSEDPNIVTCHDMLESLRWIVKVSQSNKVKGPSKECPPMLKRLAGFKLNGVPLIPFRSIISHNMFEGSTRYGLFIRARESRTYKGKVEIWAKWENLGDTEVGYTTSDRVTYHFDLPGDLSSIPLFEENSYSSEY